MRTLTTELADPKYAHIERERRWLVQPENAPDLSALNYNLIEDRYIDDTRLRLRKMTDSVDGSVSLKLTKKYDAGSKAAQPIVTSYLDEAEYRLFAKLAGQALRKRRYVISEPDLEWGLDRFETPRLAFLILEIEAEEAALDLIEPPIWAGQEVTGDDRYSCANLTMII